MASISPMSKERPGDFAENNLPASDISNGIFALFRNKGKVAIVSGGGQGIGFEVATALAESGATVLIWYNSNKKTIERAAELGKKYGVTAKAYQVNITDPDHVASTVKEIVDEFGRLDIVIANQGVPWQKGPMAEGDRQEKFDEYKRIMTTDLDGTFYLARIAAEVWQRQKQTGKDAHGKKLENYISGSFVATASMSGLIVNIPQMQAAYNCAKSGIIHLCKSLAVEFASVARVNSVSPGYMATEISNFVPQETQKLWNAFTPLGRQGLPHELQGAYLYLASDASSYTTGTNIVVDGGYCCP